MIIVYYPIVLSLKKMLQVEIFHSTMFRSYWLYILVGLTLCRFIAEVCEIGFEKKLICNCYLNGYSSGQLVYIF